MKLRHVPELHFHYDDSVDKGERIDQLLRDDPRSPYTAAVQSELATLRGQIAVRDAALAKARSENTIDRAPRIARLAALLGNDPYGAALAIAPVDKAEPGKPLSIPAASSGP